MIHVAFDLRDPARSGIARVALSLARAMAAQLDVEPDLQLTICGPVHRLTELGVREWSQRPAALVNWTSGRHAPAAIIPWQGVHRHLRTATWFFPHWDVPWYPLPHRYVAMIYDLILVRVPGATSPLRRQLARRWITRTARHADRVLVMSDYSARDLAQFVPGVAPRIRRMTAGLDSAFLAPPPPLPADIQAFMRAGPCMLTVGNRKRHKNLMAGVEVLAHIPDLRWVVVGERFPAWDPVAERAAAAGVANRMLVLDPVSDPVLCALYHAARCLFLPSRLEGYGLPVLEATACGTPVVCSTAGSLPEVAGACATLHHPDDTDGFVRSIRTLLDTPARQPAPCVARARAMTWELAAAQALETIREIA